jgi:hypothetical protein
MSRKPWTEEMKARLHERRAEAEAKRKTVDYSASGTPVSIEPPITVGHDPLLERLKGGQR